MLYAYNITPEAVAHIVDFYAHVLLKYQHTFSLDDMEKNVHRTIYDCRKIEVSLLRRQPTIARWQGYHMAHAGHWYYAYTIDGDTITIQDACHEQNMHE